MDQIRRQIAPERVGLLISLAAILAAVALYRRRFQPRTTRPGPTTAGTQALKWIDALTSRSNMVCCISFETVLQCSEDDIAQCLKIAKCCRLIVIAFQTEPARAKEVLTRNMLLDAGLQWHRVLFCQTTIGFSSIARQLNPALLLLGKLGLAEFR